MKREDAIFCQNCNHFTQLFCVTTQGEVLTTRYGLCKIKKNNIQDNFYSVECAKYKPLEFNSNLNEKDIRAYKILAHYLKKTLVHINRYLKPEKTTSK